jgi:hypothetical protein
VSSDIEAPAHDLRANTLQTYTEQVRRLQQLITDLPTRKWDSYFAATAQTKWDMVCSVAAAMNLRYLHRLTIAPCLHRSIPPPYNLGVFSLTTIQAGQPVCGYTGQYLSSETHSNRYMTRNMIDTRYKRMSTQSLSPCAT